MNPCHRRSSLPSDVVLHLFDSSPSLPIPPHYLRNSASASSQSALTLSGSNRGLKLNVRLAKRGLSSSRSQFDPRLPGLDELTVELLLGVAEDLATALGAGAVSFKTSTLARCVLIMAVKAQRSEENCSSW
jgi:hypothetical protein